MHCDDVVYENLPICIRYFVVVHRLPAAIKAVIVAKNGLPVCFANYSGKRVRLTMASRMGDVGITYDLDRDAGYDARVDLKNLTHYSDRA